MLRQASNFIFRTRSRTTVSQPPQRAFPVPFIFGSRFVSNVKETLPINNDIPYAYVRVVDPETRKPLPPKLLTEVINDLATDVQHKKGGGPPRVFVTQYAQMVAPPSEATDGYALVKLVDRREAATRERAQRLKAQASRRASEEKEIQFAWGIGAADVQHKLRKARQELSRGVRVQLVFVRKATGGAGRDSSTKEKQNMLVMQVVEALSDVAREWRVRDERKNMVVAYLQDLQRPIPHKSMLVKQAALSQPEKP
ncbi:hypothetical protein B0F90DRAFT_1727151 [Multifurca ochricompacta]|uniref:Uncharacterized protein n=1 Tax=Multifurca ochricompacta TaxID=376703 RepID=A0AAD4M3C1_9AGAM|nr:hypothetical protein B0F90DRAFT_1727151 [Multifurca ochricompacta]